jgi:hypothetical protein
VRVSKVLVRWLFESRIFTENVLIRGKEGGGVGGGVGCEYSGD